MLSGQQKTCMAKDGFLELQSSGLSHDASENDPQRWTENEVRTPVLRTSPTFSAHSRSREKDERRAYTRRILLSSKTWDRLNRVTPAWRRRPNSTQRTAVMACADLIGGPDKREKPWQHGRNQLCLGGSGLAEPDRALKGKVGCAEAAPKPSRRANRGRGEPYAVRSCTYGSPEGCDMKLLT